MGKHGFAEKLHFQLKLVSDEVGSFDNEKQGGERQS
jgi:hypothetical protein